MVLFAIFFQKHRNNFLSELFRLREEGERREQRLLEELRQKGQLLTRQNTILGQPLIQVHGRVLRHLLSKGIMPALPLL
jgi:hypothetical protein